MGCCYSSGGTTNVINNELLLKIILDCSALDIMSNQPIDKLLDIERKTQDLCYHLHMKRTQLLCDINRQQPKTETKDKQKIKSLKQNCSLFSQLSVSCQVRNGDLEEFFRYKYQSYPPALSQFGEMRLGSKSDLLVPLERLTVLHEESPNADLLVIDGVTIINMLKPRGIEQRVASARGYDEQKQVITTKGSGVLCRLPKDISTLSPFTDGTADTRMMLHVYDAIEVSKRVLLRTVDTDVVVIVISVVHANVNEFWIDFGVGKNFRYLAVHDIAKSLGNGGFCSFTPLQVVIKYCRLLRRERKLHGIHGLLYKRLHLCLKY
ncbi:unnamed protein product [Mytilus coruscus]|uniref:Uncharacterized protein n=1 Tax=Mytilus coruscus TaxID=42192 RepID=A0A6J8C325_MYTCO|nr:unnamed protein product [Mytilus coruscus]